MKLMSDVFDKAVNELMETNIVPPDKMRIIFSLLWDAFDVGVDVVRDQFEKEGLPETFADIMKSMDRPE